MLCALKQASKDICPIENANRDKNVCRGFPLFAMIWQRGVIYNVFAQIPGFHAIFNFSPQVHLFPNFPDTFTEQWVYFAKLNHPYFFTLSQTQQSWESRDSRKWGQKSQLITLWRIKYGKRRAIVRWIVHFCERYLRVCMSQVPYPRNVLEKKNALSLVRDQDIRERISDWRATKLVGGRSKDAVPSAIWSFCFPFCVEGFGDKYMRHWTSSIWCLCFHLSVE